ncbi:MAG: hypothetical protein JW774_12120 [Candidatus Aureabacteria bacterium]|nr:hypothetical protein [Candidatus Auribacterota bacterium]
MIRFFCVFIIILSPLTPVYCQNRSNDFYIGGQYYLSPLSIFDDSDSDSSRQTTQKKLSDIFEILKKQGQKKVERFKSAIARLPTTRDQWDKKQSLYKFNLIQSFDTKRQYKSSVYHTSMFPYILTINGIQLVITFEHFDWSKKDVDVLEKAVVSGIYLIEDLKDGFMSRGEFHLLDLNHPDTLKALSEDDQQKVRQSVLLIKEKFPNYRAAVSAYVSPDNPERLPMGGLSFEIQDVVQFLYEPGYNAHNSVDYLIDAAMDNPLMLHLLSHFPDSDFGIFSPKIVARRTSYRQLTPIPEDRYLPAPILQNSASTALAKIDRPLDFFRGSYESQKKDRAVWIGEVSGGFAGEDSIVFDADTEFTSQSAHVNHELSHAVLFLLLQKNKKIINQLEYDVLHAYPDAVTMLQEIGVYDQIGSSMDRTASEIIARILESLGEFKEHMTIKTRKGDMQFPITYQILTRLAQTGLIPDYMDPAKILPLQSRTGCIDHQYYLHVLGILAANRGIGDWVTHVYYRKAKDSLFERFETDALKSGKLDLLRFFIDNHYDSLALCYANNESLISSDRIDSIDKLKRYLSKLTPVLISG